MIDPCCVGVHITYWGRSLNTPGHPEMLLHSNPMSESPQISAQSSSGSSGGSLLCSTGFLDSRLCSRPPTNLPPSVERSNADWARHQGGTSTLMSSLTEAAGAAITPLQLVLSAENYLLKGPSKAH